MTNDKLSKRIKVVQQTKDSVEIIPVKKSIYFQIYVENSELQNDGKNFDCNVQSEKIYFIYTNEWISLDDIKQNDTVGNGYV